MNLRSLLPGLSATHSGAESPLRRFWKWWSGELLHFVPPPLREFFDHEEQILFVSANDTDMTVEILHGTERRETDWTRLGAEVANIEAVVELSPAQAVNRQVSLPFGTEDRIEDVLGFEMDRLTPFAKDDVYFHYFVTGRDTERRVINIQLVVALRKIVDDILDRLRVRGVVPSKVTLRGATGSAERALTSVNLLPSSKRTKANPKYEIVPTALSALAGILALIAISYPLAQQVFWLKSLDEEISRLAPAAIAAEKTQTEIADAVRLGGFFSDKWASAPTKIRLLNELTRIIPDDTWLARVQMQGTTVRIHGESEGASSLIALIEASDVFRDASFSSPVTKNPRTSTDRFVIETQIETSGDGE